MYTNTMIKINNKHFTWGWVLERSISALFCCCKCADKKNICSSNLILYSISRERYWSSKMRDKFSIETKLTTIQQQQQHQIIIWYKWNESLNVAIKKCVDQVLEISSVVCAYFFYFQFIIIILCFFSLDSQWCFIFSVIILRKCVYAVKIWSSCHFRLLYSLVLRTHHIHCNCENEESIDA